MRWSVEIRRYSLYAKAGQYSFLGEMNRYQNERVRKELSDAEYASFMAKYAEVLETYQRLKFLGAKS